MPVPKGQIGVGGLLVPTYKDDQGNTGKVLDIRNVKDGEQLVDSVPTYATANVTHDATTHVLSMTITATNIPKIAEFYFFTPATLPRNDEPLSMDYNGQGSRRFALYHPDGSRATISDIHPSALYIALLHQESGGRTRRYTLTEILGPRPQDFVIHLFVFEHPTDVTDRGSGVSPFTHVLTQDLVDNATAHTMSTATQPRVNLPSGFTYANDFSDYNGLTPSMVLYFAVPENAPNIRSILYANDSRGFGSIDNPVSSSNRLADTFTIGGVEHKFIRTATYGSFDFSNDPVTSYLPLDNGNGYYGVSFEGLPTPTLADVT